MYRDEEEDKTVYDVVMNHEEQYSIWPAGREIPLGWKAVGKTGLKPECLEYIKEVWTDMRSLSLRKKMEEDARNREANPQPVAEPPARTEGDGISELVRRLSEGEHPVTAGGPNPSAKKLGEEVGREYVHIKFTATKGGTDLGVRLDKAASKTDGADFENAEGSVHLEGTLKLNYVPVRCIADIDLASLEGTGHLEILETSE